MNTDIHTALNYNKLLLFSQINPTCFDRVEYFQALKYMYSKFIISHTHHIQYNTN